MNENKAKQEVTKYLRSCNIEFIDTIYGGLVTPLDGHTKCPDSTLNCSFDFYETYMEARVYYSKNASNWLTERPECWPNVYRLTNFLNASTLIFSNDGMGGMLYPSRHRISPKFFVTEAEPKDITCATLVDYDLLESYSLEVCDVITAAMPFVMNELSIPLFYVVLDRMGAEEAINYIERKVLRR